jgi:CRISPR/Cas system-associated protein Cas7 (RAMP superfamily)
MNKTNTITYGYISGNKNKIHHRSIQCDLDNDNNHYIEVGGKRYKAKGYIVCIDLTKIKEDK